jgi:type II secretory pathway predicted ATPase ExeA
MRYAGEEREVFTSSAVDAVYNFSGGIARKINKACSMALLYAAQKTMRTIDGGIIDYVVEQELSW